MNKLSKIALDITAGSKLVRIALRITAAYRYLYDPNHNDKPAGNWKMTKSGWSTKDDTADPTKGTSSGTGVVEKKETTNTTTKTVQPINETNNTTNVQMPVPQGTGVTQPKKEDEENIFTQDGNGFVTDEQGKKEEQSQTAPAQGEQDLGLFDDSHAAQFTDEAAYDAFMQKLLAFIKLFDEGEGKENDVTFKAIAANLDWGSLDEVRAFSAHCTERGLAGADEILAFLYFMHRDNKDKFDKIVAEMP